MGVESRIILYARNPDKARAAAAAAFDRIAAIEQALSDYRPESEASRLTQSPPRTTVPISEDLYQAIAAAEEVSLATGGALDITISPVVRIWREARRTGIPPTNEALESAWSKVGFTSVLIDRRASPGRRTAALDDAGLALDFGAIGKGFAAQRAADLLRSRGFPRSLVALAGDIVANDPPLDEHHRPTQGWRIAIHTGLSDDPAPTLILRNAAVSTSGDAEQFFTIGATRYAHIIDGRLARRSVPPTLEDHAFRHRRAATVVSARGEWADALGTALTVLGPEWIEQNNQPRLRSLLKRFGNAWASIEWEHNGAVRTERIGPAPTLILPEPQNAGAAPPTTDQPRNNPNQ